MGSEGSSWMFCSSAQSPLSLSLQIFWTQRFLTSEIQKSLKLSYDGKQGFFSCLYIGTYYKTKSLKWPHIRHVWRQKSSKANFLFGICPIYHKRPTKWAFTVFNCCMSLNRNYSIHNTSLLIVHRKEIQYFSNLILPEDQQCELNRYVEVSQSQQRSFT